MEKYFLSAFAYLVSAFFLFSGSSEWAFFSSFWIWSVSGSEQHDKKQHRHHLLCATYVKPKMKSVCFDKLSSASWTKKKCCLSGRSAYFQQYDSLEIPLLFSFKMRGDFRINELLSRVKGSWVIFAVRCCITCCKVMNLCVSQSVYIILLSRLLPLLTASCHHDYLTQCFGNIFAVVFFSDLGQVRDGWEEGHTTPWEQLPEGPWNQTGRHIRWSQAGQTLEQGGMYFILEVVPFCCVTKSFFCCHIAVSGWKSTTALTKTKGHELWFEL